MKKIFLYLSLFFIGITVHAQSGVNTKNPRATLDVQPYPDSSEIPDGIIAPKLTGSELKAKDALYGLDQTGAIIYAIDSAAPVTMKTQNVTSPGYYYFNGAIWVSFRATSVASNDATRFLGGTVYARFNSTTVGSPTIDNSKVIGGAVSTSYQIGTLTQSSNKGGVVFLKGNGYTISNPSQGIFDIKFDTPMEDIYGISVNVLDGYGTGGAIAVGTYPQDVVPGARLLTTDNAQVSFISNEIIRIKTGGSSGTLTNRPFTFLITGK